MLTLITLLFTISTNEFKLISIYEKMVSKEKIKKDINILIEIIYKNYIRDSRSGKISLEPIKSFGKILNKRGALVNHDNPTLFNYGK